MNKSSEGTGKANPKPGVHSRKGQFMSENKFGPVFLPVYCFHLDISCRPQFWQNWSPVPPVWDVYPIALITHHISQTNI